MTGGDLNLNIYYLFDCNYTMEVQGITHVDESGVWVETTDPPVGNNVDWVEVFRMIDEYQLVEQFLNLDYWDGSLHPRAG